MPLQPKLIEERVRLKPVNDALGHSAGDELLQAVAARIRREVRESDGCRHVPGQTGESRGCSRMNGIRQWTAAAALCAATVAAVFTASADPGFSSSVTPGLISHFMRLHGQGVRGRLDGWQEFARGSALLQAAVRGGSGEIDALQPVNGFFNRLAFVTDLANWRVEDYWATPAEFLSSNAGDCEDYAIAKYFMLRELGVPVGRLRMVYARAGRSGAAHMVLAYYSAPGADPLILDNLERRIARASERPDLIPVYLFNDDDLEILQRGAPATRVDAHSNRKWQEVLAKLVREQTL